MSAEVVVPRILPRLTDENRFFWTGGRNGELLILWCESCRCWVHPPVGACPRCAGALAPKPVSGRGTIFTFTVNWQQYHPDVPPPYVVAVVQLAEQDDLRLPTNIVHAANDELQVGGPVRVVFEACGEVFVPLFELDR